MKTYIVQSALCAAVLFGTAAAQAQEVKTNYRPYELATLKGQRVVLDRIANAARQACGWDRSLQGRIEARACTAELTKQMVASSKSAALVAMSEGAGVKLASNGR